ncbi:uncharacterized protein [Hoplias malabaricus]
MEKTPRKHQQDAPTHYSDIFKPLQGPDGGVNADNLRLRDRKEDKGAEEQEIRSVLTKGIAGIGKTVSVQKFIVDWADGAANEEVDLMFVLPFRELNLIKDDQYSLLGLVCAFHPELRDLDPEKYDQLRAVFIFDGLDESKVPLDFEQCEKVSDITMTSSVGVLMTNLIRGDLLPSALIWITSRPAAANQIPPQYIHRVTEIQGFTDPQKEEYFKKRIRDQDQAQKIISHIKTVRSLHIMCHIPVFCWISATVLQRMITQSNTEIPKTLTEMYSHFLLTQTNMKKEKYEEKDESDPEKLLESNRTKLLKLAELAFTQLLKGNVMFYEEDLRESSIDVTEASVYSGIFTEIFREECVIHQRKVYCFVHLSFQEFLAAVFVFHCYENNIMEPLQCLSPWCGGWSVKVPLDDLLKGAVDKSVKSPNGHLDLFLRFLLGLSLESNQSLLQGLLTQTHSGSAETTWYIKRLIKGDTNPISTERSINLFLCLSEIKDQSLYREIEEFLTSETHSQVKLSPGQCSALTYIILTSEEELVELDLSKYNTSEEGYRRLIPAVAVCRKAQLISCNMDSWRIINSALKSVNCPLKELDLSNNDLQDSGVELLSAGLKSSHCKLETLRLPGCNLTKDNCDTLGSVLQSVHSSLKELDLSNNDLQDSGVELLSAGLKSSLCKLETLRLSICNFGNKSCKTLRSALQSVNCPLKKLDLSNNDLQDSGVKLISAGLKSSHCKLETLSLSGCTITEEGCSPLASALKSNPSHLRELDLSYNHPGDSEVKLLSDLQQDPHCALEKLQSVKMPRKRKSDTGSFPSSPRRQRVVQRDVTSNTSTMDLQNSRNQGGTSDQIDQSMEYPHQFSSGRDPTNVSVKRDRSMENPPQFSSGRDPTNVSLKSDWSMNYPPHFSSERDPTNVSVKRDRSMENPPQFSSGRDPTNVSLKSDWSMNYPPHFSSERDPTNVSLKSDWSMNYPPHFTSERDPTNVSLKSDWSMNYPPHFSCGRSAQSSCDQPRNEWILSDQKQHSSEEALPTLTLEKGPRDVQQDSYPAVEEVLHRHRTRMKNRYENLFEGIRTPENKILLNRVYTQLHIIEGESEGVNEEHEVLQIEKTPRKHQPDAPFHFSDIFKPLQGPDGGVKAEEEKEEKGAEEQKIRRVLTKGIAGIGKTVSVQKFIVDWAEGAANQEVDLMFVLPFRELNLIKDDQYSLHGLLCAFHPELRDMDPEIYDQLRAVFIFDGLDESRVPLDFKQCEKVSDITVTSSVGVFMTNLIRGDLLPSALIWITSRPAAANQIPPQYIHRVTEIQGFTDPQKEEYFRKRIRDQDQAQKIISHIKTVRSLHIMCHIPVFCWISATVLQRIITQSHTEIPKTLTEMYSHFLRTQTNMKKEKYEEKVERDPKKLLESNRTKLLKLAELAFTQLLKGNVMFYEEDLRESSIDVTEASVYSGIFTEIFREECVIHQRKVYCFVHLSFQEFLAAVFVFHCCENNITEPLQCFIPGYGGRSVKVPLDDLLKGAVDKAVKSQNGHLDLFLRFLLGLSLESNQNLLQGLLTHTHSGSEETREYIKKLIKQGGGEFKFEVHNPTSRFLSTERSINLFLCLSEMKDQSLSREIEEFLNSEKHSQVKLSPGQCSALVYMLLSSEKELEELDLRKYCTSEEGYRRLIPAVTVCRKARLIVCKLDSWRTLKSALESVNCPLKLLDLNNNDLQDSALEMLSAGLKSSHCKLETLRLTGCNLTKDSCETLRLVLQSVNSSLKELDLSNNDLQDSGVELLSTGLKSSLCKLETLRLSGCMITEEGFSFLASALNSNPSHLRELHLTYNHPGESGMKLLSDLLQDPHYALKKLQTEPNGEIWMKLGLKKYSCDLTLNPNTAHIALSLSEGNRKVEHVWKTQPYPDHPERFDGVPQVLSVESLTGRCYWEVEWSGQEEMKGGGLKACISVSYRGIQRKGEKAESVFGRNKFSWSLICAVNRYRVRHNNQETEIPAPPSHSNRVGVYLDWGSGTLSFYTISPHTHTLTHLHTFTSNFTEPLYAGFGINLGSVQLC